MGIWGTPFYTRGREPAKLSLKNEIFALPHTSHSKIRDYFTLSLSLVLSETLRCVRFSGPKRSYWVDLQDQFATKEGEAEIRSRCKEGGWGGEIGKIVPVLLSRYFGLEFQFAYRKSYL